jgi:hypothetical protein
MFFFGTIFGMFFSTLFSTTIVQDGLPRRFAPRNDGECEIGNEDATIKRLKNSVKLQPRVVKTTRQA